MSKSAEQAAEALQAILAAISRDDLIAELASREGISAYPVLGGESYLIQKTDAGGVHDLEKYHGPVRIITVDGES